MQLLLCSTCVTVSGDVIMHLHRRDGMWWIVVSEWVFSACDRNESQIERVHGSLWSRDRLLRPA